MSRTKIHKAAEWADSCLVLARRKHRFPWSTWTFPPLRSSGASAEDVGSTSVFLGFGALNGTKMKTDKGDSLPYWFDQLLENVWVFPLNRDQGCFLHLNNSLQQWLKASIFLVLAPHPAAFTVRLRFFSLLNVSLAFYVMKQHKRLLLMYVIYCQIPVELAWGTSLILSALHQIWTCSFCLLGKCSEHLGFAGNRLYFFKIK